jgi:PAS domain S-box-containing protein
VERRRLAAVIEQLPVGVVVAEAPGGRILTLNAAVRRIWGAAPLSQAISEYKTDYVGFHADTGQRYESHEWPLARTLATGEVVIDEIADVERPDGSRIFVSLNSAPVRDAGGQLVGGVVTSQDVTEREELLAARAAALQAAETARAAAEAANRAKAEFLAAMSHELRTPLNAIGGYVDLLDLEIHGTITTEQKTALGRITVNQRHLLRLINDILQFARVEAGRVELEPQPVLLGDLFRKVEQLVAPLATARGIAYSAHVGDIAELTVDEERVSQILLNLIQNAVKFTPQGGWVVLTAAADGEGVCFEVRDNGPGIPEEKQERIFDPFVQIDRRMNNPQGGVGLGLAISRDLARAMGGDLSVRSIPGEGSTFVLRLPRA